MIAEIEARRKAVTGHCYRMPGSAVDAGDAAQETLIRAWRKRRSVRGAGVGADVALPDRDECLLG